MVEIRGSFRTFEQWSSWSEGLGDLTVCRNSIVADITSLGFVEPMTGLRRHPYQIAIRPNNLHESISSFQLNSRKRALLAQIDLDLRARSMQSRRDLRILGAECLSRIALILRGIYPFYLGTEYLPDASSVAAKFPVPHMDLQHIQYDDNTFDLFISGDVFEHVPDLDKAIREVMRVLKPGGLLISSFPFNPHRRESEIKSSISQTGEIVHHAPPEYHGNPVDPEAGSLVFQYPGWDILEKLRGWGFSDAYYSTIASSHFGIASEQKPGPYVLTAQKEGGSRLSVLPSILVAKTPLPEKLCTMLALPRSGTTLLTSMFAVHSEVVAVYEPWNSKVLKTDDAANSQIRILAAKEKLPSLAGKILFVKETAANPDYIRAIRRLHELTPYPVERHAIFLLRDPDHTLLSEVERRNEWWGDNVSLGTEFIANWVKGRGRAIEQIIDFVRSAGGVIVAFEEVAARPEAIMRELADRIGFCFEREQVDYEKHMGKLNVRGDLNVSRNPERINLSRALSRTEKIDQLQEMIAATPAAAWFEACRAIHTHVCQLGGIMPVADIPAQFLETLWKANQSS
jgi:SAM-dependent methyltransferase